MGQLDFALLNAFPWILLSSVIEAGALTLLRIGGKWNIIYAAAIFACAVVPLLSKALESNLPKNDRKTIDPCVSHEKGCHKISSVL
jgi:hypothetical protein